jgi:hypothetical protein
MKMIFQTVEQIFCLILRYWTGYIIVAAAATWALWLIFNYYFQF